MRLLSGEGISKRYGGITTVDGVTLSVNKHETLGIIGSNGAGKTTLFNILTGFERADSGTISLRMNERELRVQGLNAYAFAHLGVGRTFQNLRLFEGMTVYENIQSAILSIKYTQIKAEDYLTLLGLTEQAEGLVSTLPYGVRKRVELARALVCACGPKKGCRLLFLDEPAAGLTTAEADELASLLLKMKEKYNVTMVLIEHHMAFIERLCNTLYAMNEGRIIAFGQPREVFSAAAVRSAIFGE